MNKQLHLLLLLLCLIGTIGPVLVNCQRNRVILGVLAQEWWHETKDSYIAASYVKYLESAGARVVPIFIDQPKEYYNDLMEKINGLLMPGGGNWLDKSGYGVAASILLDKAIELNQNGTHFPVWGTCLSFEKMIEYFANTTNWKTKCNAENLALSTDFNPDIKVVENSKLFAGASEIVQILKTENVTAHYHSKCITVSDFNRLKLDTHFTLLSSNMIENVSSVSIIESKKYPFFGVSFHPEKNMFEFVVNSKIGNINHGPNAIKVSQYFANFLVNEARKNEHHFPNKHQELDALIYNYNNKLVYTGNQPHAYYEEIYQFPGSKSSHSTRQLWSVFLSAIVTALAVANPNHIF